MASASAAAARSAGHPPDSTGPPPQVPSFVEMRDFAATSTLTTAATNLQSPPTTTGTPATPSVAAQPRSSQDPQMQSSSTLGPAIEGPPAIIASSNPDALVLSITLMISTGARHPYRIDEKYLSARAVAAHTTTGTFDPRELKGYSLKELIWTDWRDEWEPRPASPDKIRLIILGKLVDDKKALKEYPFSFDSPNVVQISVKPSDFEEENEATHTKSNKSIRARDGDDERGAGCRCVIL
nr:hypothetical protein CFP56_72033 [Quercus suber]